MADNNRKSFLQSTKESLTPETSKTTGQKIKESITDFADKVIGAIQPATTKGIPQQVSDKMTSEKDEMKNRKHYGNDTV